MARHWSGLHTGIAIGGQVDLSATQSPSPFVGHPVEGWKPLRGLESPTNIMEVSDWARPYEHGRTRAPVKPPWQPSRNGRDLSADALLSGGV